MNNVILMGILILSMGAVFNASADNNRITAKPSNNSRTVLPNTQMDRQNSTVMSRVDRLSNMLSLMFVQETQAIWPKHGEDITEQMFSDLCSFLSMFKKNGIKICPAKKSMNVEDAIDDLFEGRSFSSDEVALESSSQVKIGTNKYYGSFNYKLKVAFLRYFSRSNGKEESDFNKQIIQDFYEKWSIRYFNGMSSFLRSLNNDEVKTTAVNFAEQVRNRNIRLRDLSPDFRKTLRAENSQHSHDPTAKDKNQQYLVKGLFIICKQVVDSNCQESIKTPVLAVDLALSPIEALLVFSHEIVHAAHPKIKEYFRLYTELKSKVVEVISIQLRKNAVNQQISESDLSEMVENLIQLTMYELNLESNQSHRALIERIQKSKLDLNQKSNLFKDKIPTDQLNDIKKWTKSILGLTIENEFIAHSFEALTAYKLISLGYLELNSPSIKLVELLKKGDEALLNRVIAIHYPVKNPSSDSPLVMTFDFVRSVNQIDLNLRDMVKDYNEVHKTSSISKNKMYEIVNFLESLFLNDLEDLMNSAKKNEWSNQISQSIEDLTSAQRTPVSQIQISTPYEKNIWVPVNSPLSPYSIIGLRTSIIQVVRFKNTLEELIRNFKEEQIHALFLAHGVWDFSDMTLIDLERGGILSCAGADRGYMDDAKKSQEVLNILLHKRLSSFLNWIQNLFPKTIDHIMALKTTLDKLESSHNLDDINEEQRNSLIDNIKSILKQIEFNENEIKQLQYLIETLISFHEISINNKDSELIGRYKKSIDKLYQVIRFVQGKTDLKQNIIEILKKKSEPFQNAIRSWSARCANDSNPNSINMLSASIHVVSLGNLGTPENSYSSRSSERRPFANLVCYQNELFAFILPDYIKNLTTQINSRNEPVFRMNINSDSCMFYTRSVKGTILPLFRMDLKL